MKLYRLLKFNTNLFLSIAAIALLPNKLRNPFEFEVETIQEAQKESTEPQKPQVNLGKWNIKEIQNDFLIIENDEGQIRTIRISSFT